MLTKEDVEGWNKIFADCQIKQSDLAQPTVGFLVRALVCYTQRFGYKVEPSFALNTDSVDNNRENRLFLIRLVRQVDHFLKITDKSYSFNYYDLIRPTPKKTAHTLYILLNYLFYYNMYKEVVFKLANDPIRKFKDMTAAIERTRRNNEIKIQEALDLQASIEALDSELAVIQLENKELCKRIESQKDNKKKLNEKREKLEKSLKHMQEQKRALCRKIVSDDEARDLRKQIEYLKAEFEKFQINEGSSVGKLRELEDSVSLLQHSIKEIENASDILPKRLLEQILETNKQLEEAKKVDHDAEHRKTVLSQHIEEETQTNEVLEHEYQKEKEEFQLKQIAHMKTIDEMRNVVEQKNVHALALQEEDNNLESLLKEQNDIVEYLKKSIAEIFAAYTD